MRRGPAGFIPEAAPGRIKLGGDAQHHLQGCAASRSLRECERHVGGCQVGDDLLLAGSICGFSTRRGSADGASSAPPSDGAARSRGPPPAPSEPSRSGPSRAGPPCGLRGRVPARPPRSQPPGQRDGSHRGSASGAGRDLRCAGGGGAARQPSCPRADDQGQRARSRRGRRELSGGAVSKPAGRPSGSRSRAGARPVRSPKRRRQPRCRRVRRHIFREERRAARPSVRGRALDARRRSSKHPRKTRVRDGRACRASSRGRGAQGVRYTGGDHGQPPRAPGVSGGMEPRCPDRTVPLFRALRRLGDKTAFRHDPPDAPRAPRRGGAPRGAHHPGARERPPRRQSRADVDDSVDDRGCHRAARERGVVGGGGGGLRRPHPGWVFGHRGRRDSRLPGRVCDPLGAGRGLRCSPGRPRAGW